MILVSEDSIFLAEECQKTLKDQIMQKIAQEEELMVQDGCSVSSQNDDFLLYSFWTVYFWYDGYFGDWKDEQMLACERSREDVHDMDGAQRTLLYCELPFVNGQDNDIELFDNGSMSQIVKDHEPEPNIFRVGSAALIQNHFSKCCKGGIMSVILSSKARFRNQNKSENVWQSSLSSLLSIYICIYSYRHPLIQGSGFGKKKTESGALYNANEERFLNSIE